MKRRTFFTRTSLAILAGGVSKSVAQIAKEDADLPLAGIKPVVMAPRQDGCEILWQVASLSKGYIEYGETSKLGKIANNDGWGLRPSGDRVIRVKIDGLQAGKTYFYRAVQESFDTKHPKVTKSQIRSFTTLNEKASTAKFAIWNDTHKHKKTLKALAEVTPKSDFLLWNGDISNNWYTEEDLLQSMLEVNGIDMTADHPLFVLRGNHDLRGQYAGKFQDYCAMPEGKPWYAFRQGPLAVICLDTGEDKPDDHPNLFGRVACEPMLREQAEWLAQIVELPAFKTAPYRVVCCHIPLRWKDEKTHYGYDFYSKRSRDLWHESLVKWKTQIVISGHTHSPWLTHANKEFPYAQLVGGGPAMNQATLITGSANNDKLSIKSVDLQGKLVSKISFKPLA